MIKKPSYNFAAIFDMDGVIVDNFRFHYKSWATAADRLGFRLTRELYQKRISGRRNIDILKYLAKGKLAAGELKKIAWEKEERYRELYKDHIKPVKGLQKLLSVLKRHNIKTAIATSGPKVNVDFVLRNTGTRKYFKHILNSSHVSRGKPHPEIYLETAKLVKTAPKDCVVFEDALNGIAAAQRAGMKVIAIATTNRIRDLQHADLAVKDFSKLTLGKINSLFK